MTIPNDISTWLKIIGAGCTALGSILLAWRVKEIMQWVVYCLVAHEKSISQIKRVLNNQTQTDPIIEGVPIHLLNIQNKIGVVLLILGFLLLAIGMMSTATSYFFTT